MQVYKAAKYIRLSYTDDKSNESNSVGNQRKLIEDFVSRHPEIELVSEKVDDGYSGVIFDRPAFKEMMDKKKNIDVIGQFGVGFYSAFMVCKKIVVESKSINSDKSYL